MIASGREHLQQAGETYFQHLRFAALVGAMLLAAGVACIIHSLVPSLCRRSASSIVGLVTQLMSDRHQLRQAAKAASGALTLVGLIAICAVPTALLLISGAHAMSGPLALLLAGLPLAYLLSNPDLEPVA